MKVFKILPVLLLAGCTYTLPPEMTVTAQMYQDPDKLAEVCGEAKACVLTDRESFCEMHLPLAANLEPLSWQHEITHCAGRKDTPRNMNGL